MITIAVCLNSTNQTATLDDATHINLYSPVGSAWECSSSFLFSTEHIQRLPELRKSIQELIETLASTRVIVFKQLIGLSYSLFDNAGFHIWEFDGAPDDYLDFISKKEVEIDKEMSQATQSTDNNYLSDAGSTDFEKVASPLDYFTALGDGKYICNIKQILNKHSQMTSKKILLPFLEQVTFYELHLIVDHLPPWLVTMKDAYHLEVVDLDHNGKKIILTPARCSS